MNARASDISIKEEYLKDTQRIKRFESSNYHALPKYTDGSALYF